MPSRRRNQRGQSVLELLVAMAIFVMVVSGITFLALDAQVSNRQGAERSRATFLAQEGAEAALSIQNQGWKYVQDGEYGLVATDRHYWRFTETPDTIDPFTRTVTVESVARDKDGNIVASGGTADPDTKKVTTRVNWDFQPNRPSEVVLESYITNWRSIKWIQTSQSDFQSGTMEHVAAPGEYVQLVRQTGVKSNDWAFDAPSDYQADPAKIKVSESQARLVGTGTVIYSGQTSNPSFTSNLNSWTYATWDRQPSEPSFSGSQLSSGGNPGGWARVRYVAAASQTYQTGGFFQQSFTVAQAGITSATVHLDWIIQQIYGTTQPRAQLYVFLSTASGEPVRDSADQIWTSGWQTAVNSWAPVDIPVTTRLQSPGTYYLKLAVWVEGNSGTNSINIGFDNAQASWQKSAERYPTDSPTIQPIKSFSSGDIQQWQGFEEKSEKNGGEIYYQISNDNGTTWQYWNGSRWRTARNARNYNTASEVNQQISSFSTANHQILFKAFFVSDGTQLIMLDNVRINYNAVAGGTYYTTGSLISSPFDAGMAAPLYNYLYWSAVVPVDTTLNFQIRTADTQAGLTAATWMGPDGTPGSYYSQPGQSIFGDTGLRWVQYKANFFSDGQSTPVLNDVALDYE